MDPNDIANRVGQTPGIIPGPAPRPVGTPIEIPPSGSPGSFRSVLDATTAQNASGSEPLRFSAHAMQRLQSRNITLTRCEAVAVHRPRYGNGGQHQESYRHYRGRPRFDEGERVHQHRLGSDHLNGLI
jgi:hypothetical protein